MLVTDFNIKHIAVKIIMPIAQVFDVALKHPVRERNRRALQKSVDYIEAAMPQAMGLETQKELLAFSLNAVAVPGYYLEFGVYRGGTMRYMAKRKPDKEFHGFDSFEGLPEDWLGHYLSKHTFSLQGRLPKVPASVRLHKGWFNQTLPKWREKYPGKIAFIHIDCDLYSSTVDILENLVGQMQPGTVIQFDEYFNYPNWENHEFKAWQEFVAKYGIGYEYIGFARQQVTLRITRMAS